MKRFDLHTDFRKPHVTDCQPTFQPRGRKCLENTLHHLSSTDRAPLEEYIRYCTLQQDIMSRHVDSDIHFIKKLVIIVANNCSTRRRQ